MGRLVGLPVGRLLAGPHPAARPHLLALRPVQRVAGAAAPLLVVGRPPQLVVALGPLRLLRALGPGLLFGAQRVDAVHPPAKVRAVGRVVSVAVAAAPLLAVAHFVGPLRPPLQLRPVQLVPALVAFGALLFFVPPLFGTAAADPRLVWALGVVDLLVGLALRAPLARPPLPPVDGPEERPVRRCLLDGPAAPLPLVLPQLFAFHQLVAFRARALRTPLVLLAVAGRELVGPKLEQLRPQVGEPPLGHRLAHAVAEVTELRPPQVRPRQDAPLVARLEPGEHFARPLPPLPLQAQLG